MALTYRADDSILDGNGRELLEAMMTLTAGLEEPLQACWPATAIERLVEDCGLQVVDHPTRDDHVQRYLADRSDGLMPWANEACLAARVP